MDQELRRGTRARVFNLTGPVFNQLRGESRSESYRFVRENRCRSRDETWVLEFRKVSVMNKTGRYVDDASIGNLERLRKISFQRL